MIMVGQRQALLTRQRRNCIHFVDVVPERIDDVTPAPFCALPNQTRWAPTASM
ncbi:hypothetical protein ACT691_01925 [Vibrio metschnikovii]